MPIYYNGKIVAGSGGGSISGGVDIPASDTPPADGEWWLDTSEEGEAHECASKDLSNVPNEDLVAKLEESGFGSDGVQMDLLWQNASPSSAFAAQTVSLDLSEYDYVLIYYSSSWGVHNQSGMYKKGWDNSLQGYGGLFNSASSTSSITHAFRKFTLSDTGVAFNGGYKACDGNKEVSDNSKCIPALIYGIKGV